MAVSITAPSRKTVARWAERWKARRDSGSFRSRCARQTLIPSVRAPPVAKAASTVWANWAHRVELPRINQKFVRTACPWTTL